MTKVLLDYRFSQDPNSGSYVRNLARSLKSQKGIKLCLIMKPSEDLPEELEKLELIKRSKDPLSGAGYKELREAVKVLQPDLVHCPDISTPNLKGIAPDKTIPIVTTIYDLSPLLVKGVMPSFIKRATYSGLVQRAFNWSNALIVPSEQTYKSIQQFYPKLANDDLITLIPVSNGSGKSGADTDWNQVAKKTVQVYKCVLK